MHAMPAAVPQYPPRGLPAPAVAARVLRRPLHRTWIVVAGVVAAAAQQPSFPATGAAGLVAQAASDPACAQEVVVGQCFCGALPCGLRVLRYVPVAAVETTRAPGDSPLAFALPPVPPGLPTASSSLSTTDNTAEAHVWTLPDGLLAALSCRTCNGAGARRPALPHDPSAAHCGAAAAVGQAIVDAASGVTGPVLPSLAYSSELDALNWRTGCRDLFDPASNAVSRLLACAGAAAATGIGTDCLGAWGNLLPRQMRDIGPPPLLHSAKTAMRAMSIARDQIGSFPYPVDTDGKLQQVYPAISACFRVGHLPLPEFPGAIRPAVPSHDGRYAWLYWRQTLCCIPYAVAQACPRAP